MDNDYYSSINENQVENNDMHNQSFDNLTVEEQRTASDGYYDVKEKPTRTEFYRQPEQKNMKIAMILFGVVVVIVSVIDYYLLWKTYDDMADVPDSIFYIIQTLIFVIALLQIPIQIWANELFTIIAVICTLVALYISLTNLGFTSIGLVSMVMAALQFNNAQAISGKYKRKYSNT